MSHKIWLLPKVAKAKTDSGCFFYEMIWELEVKSASRNGISTGIRLSVPSLVTNNLIQHRKSVRFDTKNMKKKSLNKIWTKKGLDVHCASRFTKLEAFLSGKLQSKVAIKCDTILWSCHMFQVFESFEIPISCLTAGYICRD